MLLLLFQSPFAHAIPAIIAGLTSAQSEINGWNVRVRDAEAMSVVRTSDTVVTITLDAIPFYDITAQEVITATIPDSALALSTNNIVATPTFTIDVAAIISGPFKIITQQTYIVGAVTGQGYTAGAIKSQQYGAGPQTQDGDC